MVPAKDLQTFQQHFLGKSPCSNDTNNFVETRPGAFGYVGLKSDQFGGVQGHFQPLLPHYESLAPTLAPYAKTYGDLSARNGVPSKDVHSSAEKRFLIFDQSGNDIRLFSSTSDFPFRNQDITPKMPAGPWSLQGKVLEAGQPSLMQLIDQTKLDENYSSSEGDDIQEDTEEINALLSFSSEDDDDNDEENDDLTSTGHSPFSSTGGFQGDEPVRELTEEVASTDGSTKRRKLLDGGYNKSSLMDTASSLKSTRFSNFNDDVESSCVKDENPDADMDSSLSLREKQDKIWEKLRILESVLPGRKRKDPILILDETISYLKSLRQKAKAPKKAN